MANLILLNSDEYKLRLAKIRSAMAETKESPDAMIITDNATTFYLTGRVFMGWCYIPAESEPVFFVRRPVELKGDGVVYVRKPELITETIGPLNAPAKLALELDELPYSAAQRLAALFPETTIVNASPMIRAARAVKTPYEITQLRASGEKQSLVYRHLPRLYTPGMSDLELQVEIERALRLEGCLGQFRISGDSMELFMGSVLVGENADNPTPYDFAMGGAGLDGSIPAGADGTIIRPGNTVMVDMNGNFTGYMTDMTRTYALGEIPQPALDAHQCSIDICHALSKMATPGTPAKELYETALQMAREAGLHEYFMGHRQKAGFIGHGVGIEINELPVIAPRSHDILQAGNVLALEPKFVIPKVGAVGIENTYAVTDHGLDSLVDCPEQIQYFEE